jgi:PPM family protein phosphatase
MSKISRVDTGFLCDLGRVRVDNEDAIFVSILPPDKIQQQPVLAFAVVADGMGGHAAGELASHSTIEVIQKQLLLDLWQQSEAILPKMLKAVTTANDNIIAIANQDPTKRGMGTTCTALAISPQRYYITHVGDSRCYLIRDGTIQQLSEDHSWVAEQVRSGILSKTEAANHPRKNVILRSLGSTTELQIDTIKGELLESDVFVLCSDGLSNYLSAAEILDFVKFEANLQNACRLMVDEANSRGGQDNISIVILKAKSKLAETQPNFIPISKSIDDKRATQPLMLSKKASISKLIYILIIVLGLALAGYFFFTSQVSKTTVKAKSKTENTDTLSQNIERITVVLPDDTNNVKDTTKEK